MLSENSDQDQILKKQGYQFSPTEYLDKLKSATPTYLPYSKRKCTDVFCIFLFLLYLAGSGGLFALIMMVGDLRRIYHPADSFGNLCGVKKNSQIKDLNPNYTGLNLENKTYLFFFSSNDPFNNYQVCVEKCPEWKISNRSLTVPDFYSLTGINVCLYNQNPNISNVDAGYCPEVVNKSKATLNRCISNYFATDFISTYTARFFKGKLVTALGDICWKKVLILSLISLGMSVVMLFLLAIIGPILCYLVFLLCFAAMIAGNIFVWYQWHIRKSKMEKIPKKFRIPSEENIIKNWLTGAIILSVASIIISCILLFMWPRLILVARLFIEATKVITRTPVMILTPFIMLVLLVGFFVFVAVLCFGLTTTSEAKVGQSIVSNKPERLIYYKDKVWAKYVWVYIFFLAVWGFEFLRTFEDFIFAYLAATVYFTRSSPLFVYLQAFRISLLEHGGTIAFGSLILALLLIPKIIFFLLKGVLHNDSTAAKFFKKCMTSVFWIFDQVIQYLTKSAYFITAISGKSFCSSAMIAFTMTMANPLRCAAVHIVGHCVIFLCQLLVVGGIFAISYFYIEQKEDDDNISYWVTIGIGCVVALIISEIIMSLFRTILDTLLFCYLVKEKEDPKFDHAEILQTLIATGQLAMLPNLTQLTASPIIPNQPSQELIKDIEKALPPNLQQLSTILSQSVLASTSSKPSK